MRGHSFVARSQLRGEVRNFVVRSQLRSEVTTSWRGPKLRSEVTTSWRGQNFVARSKFRGEVTTSWRGHNFEVSTSWRGRNFVARSQLCELGAPLPKVTKRKKILNMSYIYNIGWIKKWEMVFINFRNSGWIEMDSSKNLFQQIDSYFDILWFEVLFENVLFVHRILKIIEQIKKAKEKIYSFVTSFNASISNKWKSQNANIKVSNNIFIYLSIYLPDILCWVKSSLCPSLLRPFVSLVYLSILT